MDVSALPPPTRNAPRAAPAVPEPGAVERVAREFEAAMVGQMLEAMFAGVGNGAFGGGQSERTWRSFMLQEYGKAIAEAGSLGIGTVVQAEVARLYAAQAEGAPA